MISDYDKYRRDYNEYRNENPNRTEEDLNYRGKTPSYGYPEGERNYDRERDRSSGYFHDLDYGRPAHEYRDYENQNSYPEEPHYGGHFNRERNIGKGYHPQDYDYNRGNEDYERDYERERRNRNSGQQARDGYRRSHMAYDRNGPYEGRQRGEYGVPDFEPRDQGHGNFSMSGGRYGNSKNYRGDMNYTGARNYGGNRHPFGSGPQNEGVRDRRGSYYENRPDYIDQERISQRDREERGRGDYGDKYRRNYQAGTFKNYD